MGSLSATYMTKSCTTKRQSPRQRSTLTLTHSTNKSTPGALLLSTFVSMNSARRWLKMRNIFGFHTFLENTASPMITGKKMSSWYTLTMELSNSIEQMRDYMLIIQAIPMWIEFQLKIYSFLQELKRTIWLLT